MSGLHCDKSENKKRKKDIAQGTMSLDLENWKPRSSEKKFLNVGTGIDISVRELAEAVSNAVGYQGKIVWDTSKPDGTPKKQLNVSRLENLGWKHQIKLENGLKLTVKDFVDSASFRSC